jgi:hypothetical protein
VVGEGARGQLIEDTALVDVEVVTALIVTPVGQEEAKEPMIPGVGIAPTYTISRAVLSDAVALVRGDRHYGWGRRAWPAYRRYSPG